MEARAELRRAMGVRGNSGAFAAPLDRARREEL